MFLIKDNCLHVCFRDFGNISGTLPLAMVSCQDWDVAQVCDWLVENNLDILVDKFQGLC